MPTYLLDANIVSYFADPFSAFHMRVATTIRSLPIDGRLAIPLLAFYELAYGFVRDPGHSRLLTIIHEEKIAVIAPSEAGTQVFAHLKDAYRRRTGIRDRQLARHNVDLISASTALVEGAVLASNDGIVRTLAQVEPRLRIENWAEAT